MEKWRGNRHSCGSYFVDDCKCELDSLCPNEVVKAKIVSPAVDFSYGSNSDANPQKFQLRKEKTSPIDRREQRSFSHPAINFIFTREIRASNINPRVSNQLYNQVDLDQKKIVLNDQQRILKLGLAEFESIDKAQKFFAESGILGPTNLNNSRDFVKKTSTIHLDTSLKCKIRKTSLCLLSRTFGEKCSPSLSSTPKITFKDSNDLIVRNIQRQVYNLKGIIETGETKIIMLRAEVNKIKKVLQEFMCANFHNKSQLHKENPILCVFCQEEPGFSQALLKIKSHSSIT